MGKITIDELSSKKTKLFNTSYNDKFVRNFVTDFFRKHCGIILYNNYNKFGVD
jgi:hypothetical protein